MSISIIKATPEHAQAIFDMIVELAIFEKMPDQVAITAETIRKDIEREAVYGLLAVVDEKIAGMNLYYFAYSTWHGQYAHMEDLYVKPEFRRMGLAKKLWSSLAKIAIERDCHLLQWVVLDWNKGAIALYDTVEYINLTKKEGWYSFRMERKAIEDLANSC